MYFYNFLLWSNSNIFSKVMCGIFIMMDALELWGHYGTAVGFATVVQSIYVISMMLNVSGVRFYVSSVTISVCVVLFELLHILEPKQVLLSFFIFNL